MEGSFINSNTEPNSLAMAGAGDKARFYLERAVPQLQEFEQKKIFTKVGRAPPHNLAQFLMIKLG